ncbi:Hsp20/alpha crystallin family protein [Actinomadura livida]|jgi:HSP20 family protein|uniref:HSP20 family protein n=1 Tax=Actinomadura livida TaxID=79909 RepID=A0A7W7IB74_9ACTN|nr:MULTISPECIES: Hsp20/alpha crystallin family protein [Actinomadura]MBB4773791.1 HSP20 family protein [Actinomadura catellatispora]GGU10745.1 heat-shock protein Hsp20 [Actinomadura livida]
MALPSIRRPGDTMLTPRPRAFDPLYEQMEQLVNAAFAGTATDMPWAPAGDVSETDDAYVIETELPGLKKDEIDVSLHDRELTITGEIKERESRGLRHHKQRRTGRFEYRVYLPGDIDAEGIDAKLADGVLTVTVPKATTEKDRHIEVKG